MKRRGDFAARYARVQEQATKQGVCPKVIVSGGYTGLTRACGKKVEPGKQFCARHRYGV